MSQLLTEANVLKALSTVEEPDLKRDLVSLQMIKDISIEGNQLSFTVVLTTPACPLKELIRENCKKAIYEHISPTIQVTVNLTAEVTSLRQTAPLLPNVKNIIAIASGKGGVGKSTVTANLAIALAGAGASVGLIDADISGPSIPVMFGIEDEAPEIVMVDDRQMIMPIVRFGVRIISMGLLAPAETAVVWRGPMASKALRQFITDTHWGDLDYLLIDLPPGTSDIHLTLVQTIPITGAVLVTTPQKVALADVLKGLMMFRQPQINVPVLGVVENMAYFTPAELPENKYYLFGENGGKQFAEKYEVPFLGEIPIVQSIREAGDSGMPAVVRAEPIVTAAFEQVAQQVAQQVALRNAQIAPTQVVEIKTI